VRRFARIAKRSRLLLALIVLSSGLRLHAATFEVAQRNPNADDTGPGTTDRPFKTLSKAVEAATPGDTILVRDGVYREGIVVKRSGTAEKPIRIEAAPGAHVVVTGADRITDWKRVEGSQPVYQVPWPHRFVTWSKNMTHPDDEYHRLIGRCEQVAVDGYLLRQVLESSQLALGTFFADTSNQVLRVWDSANRDLNKVLVEASVRQEICRVEGAQVQLRGLIFRFAANMAQHGAVVLSGEHDIMENCVVEEMNSSGATFAGEHQTVRGCVFRDNGQLGFGANSAHGLLFTECLVENNNTKGFDRGWEAGGDKLVLCRDAVLEKSRFVRNRGNGLWFDIGNENCTVRQCLIADNEDSGIFYEISYGLQAHDNVIIRNGFASTAGAWGAQAGIAISSSPDCRIERNILVGNREGFNFREQKRTTPRIGNRTEVAIWNHDETIEHNLITLNRDAQVWGWFDVNDNRHWPSGPASTNGASANNTSSKPGDIAGAYGIKSDKGQPTGITLEKLRLKFAGNVYFADPGQGWFVWGVTWSKHERFATLAQFQAALGIDTGSRVINPAFVTVDAADFRLSRDAMKDIEPCYPRGPVPGVLLGINPN
jgi:hypothetical protein